MSSAHFVLLGSRFVYGVEHGPVPGVVSVGVEWDFYPNLDPKPRIGTVMLRDGTDPNCAPLYVVRVQFGVVPLTPNPPQLWGCLGCLG